MDKGSLGVSKAYYGVMIEVYPYTKVHDTKVNMHDIIFVHQHDQTICEYLLQGIMGLDRMVKIANLPFFALFA